MCGERENIKSKDQCQRKVNQNIPFIHCPNTECLNAMLKCCMGVSKTRSRGLASFLTFSFFFYSFLLIFFYFLFLIAETMKHEKNQKRGKKILEDGWERKKINKQQRGYLVFLMISLFSQHFNQMS